jgi:hypothetical protein
MRHEHTLQDISEQNWEFARRLFHCVAAASRPLRVEELAEFLAFEFNEGQFPTYLPDWRLEDPIGAVLSACPCFLAVVNVRGSSAIQLSHFSVKEYLTSQRLAEAMDTFSRFHVSMTPAHTIVVQACLPRCGMFNFSVTSDDSLLSLRYSTVHLAADPRIEFHVPDFANAFGVPDMYIPKAPEGVVFWALILYLPFLRCNRVLHTFLAFAVTALPAHVNLLDASRKARTLHTL